MNRAAYILILLFFPLNQSFGQVSTEFEAKQQLKKKGVTSSKIIENAEIITVESGIITGTGGITISLPIYEFIDYNNIIIQRSVATSYMEKNNVIIKSTSLYISAIVIKKNNRKYLFVGKNLRDIVNTFL